MLLLFVLALDVQSEAADDAAAEKVEMQAMLVTAGITLCGPWANAFVCTAPNHFIALDEQKISAGFLTSCPSFSGRLSNHHEASVRQKTITVASSALKLMSSTGGRQLLSNSSPRRSPPGPRLRQAPSGHATDAYTCDRRRSEAP